MSLNPERNVVTKGQPCRSRAKRSAASLHSCWWTERSPTRRSKNGTAKQAAKRCRSALRLGGRRKNDRHLPNGVRRNENHTDAPPVSAAAREVLPCLKNAFGTQSWGLATSHKSPCCLLLRMHGATQSWSPSSAATEPSGVNSPGGIAWSTPSPTTSSMNA